MQERIDKVNYCIARPLEYKVIICDDLMRYWELIKPAWPVNGEERWEVPRMGCLKPHAMLDILDNKLLILPVSSKLELWELESKGEF